MARAPRIQVPGFMRHVMSRGNGRMCIYLDDDDYREFLHLLGSVMEEFEIDCWNYCLMPNHYHATLMPSRANLSEAMRRLNSEYAQWWNRGHGRVGHVFQGRFKAQIVDHDSYVMTLSRYVMMNPVRAGLVRRAADWAWSSYRATAGLEPAPAFLDASSTLRLFGEDSHRILRARFITAMAAAEKETASMNRIRSRERVLGDRAFKDLVAATILSHAAAESA